MTTESAKEEADRKLAEFAAADPDVLKAEVIAGLKRDNPDIPQAQIDAELAIVEATFGF